MRIVQLITGSTCFGGAEAHVRDLTIGLKRRGHECIVLLGPPKGVLSRQLRKQGFSVVLIPALNKPIQPVRDLICLFQVIHELRRIRPEIIAAHTSKAGVVGRIAGKLVGIPSSFTPHGLSFINRKTGGVIRFRLALERIAANLGGTLIAVCEAERSLALRYLANSRLRVSTIYNGLPDYGVKVERSEGPVVITMIARFDVQKDHLTLIRALASIDRSEWELRLAGTGPLLSSTEQVVKECGLEKRVRFMGHCENTAELLAESDIFVLISKYEAFPISILEAMRAGLPIIATDTGGVSEAIENEECGFLVNPGDAYGLKDRLDLLIESSAIRKSMGAKARRGFEQRFEWRSMLDATEAAYAAVKRLKSATSVTV